MEHEENAVREIIHQARHTHQVNFRSPPPTIQFGQIRAAMEKNKEKKEKEKRREREAAMEKNKEKKEKEKRREKEASPDHWGRALRRAFADMEPDEKEKKRKGKALVISPSKKARTSPQ